MVQSELDSFYVKFKNLLRAEKDATLTIKSEAGRASITLSVDLGHVLSEPGLPHQHRPWNGPSRQRRREKRAAVRNAAAAEADETRQNKPTKDVVAEKVIDIVSNIEAVENPALQTPEAEEANNLEGKIESEEETAVEASVPV